MIPVSPLWREAVKESWSPATRVDIVRAGVVTTPGVPVSAGSYSADRTSKNRLSLDVDLIEPVGTTIDIDVNTCRLRVRAGITSLGYAEWIQLGEFRVDEIDRSVDGLVQVNASGLESYVIDDRFIRPRTPPYGASVSGEIRSLIQESLPEQRVVFRNTSDGLVTATAPWDKERWDAIDALAVTINAEVFCDYTGAFVIADAPSLARGVPVMHIHEGPGGVLTGRKAKSTRDQVYNAMAVYGQSSDPAVLPHFGFAYDNDPASPTYYYGPFGKVVKYYSSSFFTADWQCQQTAEEMLPDAMAANETVEFTSAPVPFLEVGDLVQVDDDDGGVRVHLLSKVKWPLGGGNLSADTLSTKVAARSGLDG
jgi:hypothetical protein